MAAAVLSPIPAGRARWRFSLGGMMFIFVLGLSIGLAYWRLPQVTFSQGMLASFSTWFVLGIIERLRRDVRRAYRLADMSFEARWGIRLRIGLGIGIIVLMATAAAIVVYCWQGSVLGIAWNGRPAAYSIANIIFFLVVMAAYWSPPKDSRSPSRLMLVVRPVFECALVVIAAYWAAKAFLYIMEILQLVHIAIRGVESYQPTRWLGRPFYPANIHPPDTEQLFGHLLMAFTLLAVATGANALLAFYWRRGWLVRLALLSVAAPSLVAASWMTFSIWRNGISDVSPFFNEAIHEVASSTQIDFAILIVTLGAGVALISTVRSEPSAALGENDGRESKSVLHESALVVLVCILAVLLEMGLEIGQLVVSQFPPQIDWLLEPSLLFQAIYRCCLEYTVGRCEQMIGLAAVIVLGRYLWRRWHGERDEDCIWLVRPGEFFATWIVSAVTIALVIPIVVCAALAFAISSVPH